MLQGRPGTQYPSSSQRHTITSRARTPKTNRKERTLKLMKAVKRENPSAESARVTPNRKPRPGAITKIAMKVNKLNLKAITELIKIEHKLD